MYRDNFNILYEVYKKYFKIQNTVQKKKKRILAALTILTVNFKIKDTYLKCSDEFDLVF